MSTLLVDTDVSVYQVTQDPVFGVEVGVSVISFTVSDQLKDKEVRIVLTGQ